MNLEQLKRNVGYRLKLVPPACHLDSAGDVLPVIDEDWSIVGVSDDAIQIRDDARRSYRLGKDQIRNFTTDPQRVSGTEKRGFLTLHVQLFVQADDVRAVPNHQPGAPVAPPVNRALKARQFFAPELQRIFRRLVEVLDRIIPNYTATSHGRGPCPGDTWTSLKPSSPDLYPTATLMQDLSAADSQLLAEFYSSAQCFRDILDNLIATDYPLDCYNVWNVLMQQVQHSLRAGQAAVERFCPDRLYDPLVPVAGTLLARAQRSVSMVDTAMKKFQERCAAAGGCVEVSNPMGLRRAAK